MRLRQVNMYTPRIRVGQRLKTVQREKQSVRLQTVGQQNRAAEVKKQTSNLTCLLAIVCACTNSSLPNCNNTGSSLHCTAGICPLLPRLPHSDRTPNSEQISQLIRRRLPRNISALQLLHTGLRKTKHIGASVHPTSRSQTTRRLHTNKFHTPEHQLSLSSGTYPQWPRNRVLRGNILRTD